MTAQCNTAAAPTIGSQQRDSWLGHSRQNGAGPADLEDLVGRDLDGRYVLEQFIDKGGFGAVYRGTDRKFNLPVAVKVGFSSREFMKEARLAAEVRHGHIVQVIDFGCDNGLAYLVMEYLDGETVENLFRHQRLQLTPQQLCKFVDEVGSALAFAHSVNLIHRDLKPRNIILRGHTLPDTPLENTKFVLLDFGIAAKLDAEGTQRNRTLDGAGTVEYMAPELLTQFPRATPLSDIYAFGVILYQFMTGRVPFPQSNTSHIALAECLNAIATLPPPAFGDPAGTGSSRRYPAELEQLVLQCLEKDPANRPQSMNEVRSRFLRTPNFQTDRTALSTVSPADLSNTRPPAAAFDTKETCSLQTMRASVPNAASTAKPPATKRMLFAAIAATIMLTATMGGGLYYIGLKTIPTYALLTYEQGHVSGQSVDDNTKLTLQPGGSLRLTFLIEGPEDDVVNFVQPETPDGVKIETMNGPVPFKSKCFLITLDEHFTAAELPPIVLTARSATRTKPFEKIAKISVKR